MWRFQLALTLILASHLHAQEVHLLYRGAVELPAHTRDQHRKEFQITGLSGITYAGGSTFWSVMDNSDKLVKLDITFKDDCSVRKATVSGGVTLREKHDYEGIAITDDGFYLSEEDTPGIHQFDPSRGRKPAVLPVPDVYLRTTIRNQGFESLTITRDGKTLWTANERALLCDGNLRTPAEPFGSTTKVRLLRFELSEGEAKSRAQFVYQTSGVHDVGGQIGLCDLASLPDGRLLALERSAAQNLQGRKSIRTRIYVVDVAGATDVSGPEYRDGLKDKPVTKVSKSLLYDGFVFDDDGENVEGLCLGPQVQKGRYIVVGVVDDGEALHVSGRRLVAFELLLPQ